MCDRNGGRRLRQWLIEQIDSSMYPGLIWETEEKSMFRIPWKHAGKQDYNQEVDASIFKVSPGPRTQSGRPSPWRLCPMALPGLADTAPRDVSSPSSLLLSWGWAVLHRGQCLSVVSSLGAMRGAWPARCPLMSRWAALAEGVF